MSFKPVDGDTVILCQKGVWKTADLFTLDGSLFAKFGGGFIRLRGDGTTSKDGVTFTMLATDKSLFKDQFNRITLAPERGQPLKLDKPDNI